jgi:hypothetical protein
MSEGICSVLWNVVGGVITAFLTYLCLYVRGKVRERRFRRVFGSDVAGDFFLVYCDLQPPGRDTVFGKPPSKVPRRSCGACNLWHVTGGGESRSLGYLGNTFGQNSAVVPRISTDADLDSEMDLSFVSLGGLTNFKSADVLDNEANPFVTFAQGDLARFVSRRSGRTIMRAGRTDDYAMIVKIHPPNNANRSWICCAGFGEWGTSGSAWWLSKHWRDIYKRAGERPFACITNTRVGSDSSTELVHFFCSQDEVEEACAGGTDSSAIGVPKAQEG